MSCSLQEHTALSADDTYAPEDIATYPHEFLHTPTPTDLPPHHLRPKVAMPIMVIRNVDPTEGKANGTLCIIKHITKHNIADQQ